MRREAGGAGRLARRVDWLARGFIGFARGVSLDTFVSRETSDASSFGGGRCEYTGSDMDVGLALGAVRLAEWSTRYPVLRTCYVACETLDVSEVGGGGWLVREDSCLSLGLVPSAVRLTAELASDPRCKTFGIDCGTFASRETADAIRLDDRRFAREAWYPECCGLASSAV